jgi:hypothetical protein
MTLPIFPILPGMTWPLNRKTIGGKNLVFEADSGAVATAQLWSKPIYEWDLSFDGLASNAGHPGLGVESKQLLEAFFLQCGGRASPFLFIDASDCYQAGSAFGIGDGTTTTFTAKRNVASYAETADAISNVAAVYLNGTLQASSAWNVSAPNGVDANAITFTSAPASGAVVSADFWYAFKCRFLADDLAFEQIMSGLWQLKGVKFRRERV